MPNPVVTAIRNGAVPAPAKMAAARAALPLPPEDLLEILVLLTQDADAELSATATKSLNEFDAERMKQVVSIKETPRDVLQHLCSWRGGKREVYEAIILNDSTPDQGITELARWNKDASVLELIAINQERMIRHADIISALIENKASTPEAVRRATEVRIEFFEKELGAKRIEDERRARAAAASAALGLRYVEESLVELIDEDIPAEDLKLETALGTEDDPKIGPEFLKAIRDEVQRVQDESESVAESPVSAPTDAAASASSEEWGDVDAETQQTVNEILNQMKADGEEATPERLTIMQKIARMSVKARVQLALKGNREARNILRRDASKSVILGVLGNSRITESEVEAISAMKTLPEEALRLIALNRQWIRNYPIVHNLVRNARTPVATTLPLLNRLFPKDLKALTGNRNVPDVLRKQADRLVKAKKIG
ncbi:MAG TPA: hypothetical protein VFZ34_30405 [Blastocatellia bacterium]|nr:hypothetical protein [Blastocatellia bacterium]